VLLPFGFCCENAREDFPSAVPWLGGTGLVSRGVFGPPNRGCASPPRRGRWRMPTAQSRSEEPCFPGSACTLQGEGPARPKLKYWPKKRMITGGVWVAPCFSPASVPGRGAGERRSQNAGFYRAPSPTTRQWRVAAETGYEPRMGLDQWVRNRFSGGCGSK